MEKKGPANTCCQTRPVMTMTSSGDDTLGQGSFGTWHVLPSASMVDSVTGLRCAERSRAPDHMPNCAAVVGAGAVLLRVAEALMVVVLAGLNLAVARCLIRCSRNQKSRMTA